MSDFHERTRILVGDEGIETLANQHVLVAGLGGVGGACAEALARAGIGRMTILDHDTISPSNINRQVVALHSTVGQPKAEVLGERLKDINPELDLTSLPMFLRPDAAEALIHENDYDFVLDCIDSIACKAALVTACLENDVPVASSMGAGGRLDATQARVTRLDRTRNCGLAREMRKRLRRQGITLKYPVVYSPETPVKALPHQPIDNDPTGRPRAVNGTISYMPNLFGMMLAGHVIREMLEG